MVIVYSPSSRDADLVRVDFMKPDGEPVARTLIVDCGFMGRSHFVLPQRDRGLSHAAAPASQVSGALQGKQNRALVVCRIPALSFQRVLIVIMTDLAALSLPAGVDGVAGLRFLRQFDRWGSERVAHGNWRFFLRRADD